VPVIIFRLLAFLAVALLAGLVVFHFRRRARPPGTKPQ